VLSGLVSSERLAFFEIGLLAIAAVIWLGGQDPARAGRRRLALAVAIALCGASVLYAARGAGDAPGSSLGVAPENRLIAWETWDPARVEAAVAAGRPVFVDVTADWCFTCKINEGLFLETEEVAGAFERNDVLALRADWTRPDDEIGELLASFGRYGIPFYVMYRPGREPRVLSELLSRSAIVGLLGE
jgi:thiol:disulfide interchange protein DsbD